MSTPLYIRKLSKRWHRDTRSGAYIAAANLDATVARERIARSAGLREQEAVDRDAAIRRKRWDLNID